MCWKAWNKTVAKGVRLANLDNKDAKDWTAGREGYFRIIFTSNPKVWDIWMMNGNDDHDKKNYDYEDNDEDKDDDDENDDDHHHDEDADLPTSGIQKLYSLIPKVVFY